LFTSLLIKAQTSINNTNFQQAINTCLATNPVDGMCSDSEYGAIPDWNVSTVTTMFEAFKDKSDFNGDISDWDTSKVENMVSMFFGASVFNRDINTKEVTVNGVTYTAWDVSNVTDMSLIFGYASAFNQDISNWDVSNVTNMYAMFAEATLFNRDISNWKVDNVTNMNFMFSQAFAFSQNITSWDVSRVITMRGMFYQASAFNQNIGSWNVSSVTDMDGMFQQASAFNQNIVSWNVSNVTDMDDMFRTASAFNQDIGSWDVSNATNMAFMFDNSGLSSTNYDALLNGWSQQTVQQNVVFGAAGLTYCDGEDAKQDLIATYGWTITDSGLDCATASVDNENLLAISVYPNPTSNMVYIEGNYTQLKVVIYDLLGKEILNKYITNSIDIRHLKNGVYILQLSDGLKVSSQRIVKN
jgi:surface protein